MTRALLEAAAKAMGLDLSWYEVGADETDECLPGWYCEIAGTRRSWNPITDDGDCFRMETALRLDGPHWLGESVAYHGFSGGAETLMVERFADHPNADAARRMAATRAAASLPPREGA